MALQATSARSAAIVGNLYVGLATQQRLAENDQLQEHHASVRMEPVGDESPLVKQFREEGYNLTDQDQTTNMLHIRERLYNTIDEIAPVHGQELLQTLENIKDFFNQKISDRGCGWFGQAFARIGLGNDRTVSLVQQRNMLDDMIYALQKKNFIIRNSPALQHAINGLQKNTQELAQLNKDLASNAATLAKKKTALEPLQEQEQQLTHSLEQMRNMLATSTDEFNTRLLASREKLAKRQGVLPADIQMRYRLQAAVLENMQACHTLEGDLAGLKTETVCLQANIEGLKEQRQAIEDEITQKEQERLPLETAVAQYTPDTGLRKYQDYLDNPNWGVAEEEEDEYASYSYPTLTSTPRKMSFNYPTIDLDDDNCAEIPDKEEDEDDGYEHTTTNLLAAPAQTNKAGGATKQKQANAAPAAAQAAVPAGANKAPDFKHYPFSREEITLLVNQSAQIKDKGLRDYLAGLKQHIQTPTVDAKLTPQEHQQLRAIIDRANPPQAAEPAEPPKAAGSAGTAQVLAEYPFSREELTLLVDQIDQIKDEGLRHYLANLKQQTYTPTVDAKLTLQEHQQLRAIIDQAKPRQAAVQNAPASPQTNKVVGSGTKQALEAPDAAKAAIPAKEEMKGYIFSKQDLTLLVEKQSAQIHDPDLLSYLRTKEAENGSSITLHISSTQFKQLRGIIKKAQAPQPAAPAVQPAAAKVAANEGQDDSQFIVLPPEQIKKIMESEQLPEALATKIEEARTQAGENAEQILVELTRDELAFCKQALATSASKAPGANSVPKQQEPAPKHRRKDVNSRPLSERVNDDE